MTHRVRLRKGLGRKRGDSAVCPVHVPSPLLSAMAICSNSPDSSSSPGSRVWISHLAVLGVAIAASAGVHFFLRRRSSKFRSRVVGIIPARFASSRFEGKPLALILGKPMIQVSIILISLRFPLTDANYAFLLSCILIRRKTRPIFFFRILMLLYKLFLTCKRCATHLEAIITRSLVVEICHVR